MEAIMGRSSTINTNLPPNMRKRVRPYGTYYFFDTGGKPRKEIPLGSDYIEAVRKWAELKGTALPVAITVGHALTHYLLSHEYLKLGEGTKKDYGYAFDKLKEAFGEAPLDQVKPEFIKLYLNNRSLESEHRAGREVSILGMLYRFALERGWTKFNPVSAVRRKKLPGRRDVYIEDDVLKLVYDQASLDLKDAIDLAYVLGQRPIDILHLTESDIKDGMIVTAQTKRGAKVRVPVEGVVKEVLDRILTRKRQFKVQPLSILVDELGKPMTKSKLRSRFEVARERAGAAAAHFQFRDLRAKAATDVREESDLDAAQSLMGHTSSTMTEHYTRNRKGKVAQGPQKLKYK
jgi:integrase